jgi:CRP-like cAMP-binding protein
MVQINIGDKELSALVSLTRGIHLFGPLNVVQLEKLLPSIMLYAFEAGSVVFKQGGPGDAFYIVLSGRLAVKIKKGFFGSSSQVAVLGPGHYFGEMALISRDKRTATIECLEPTQLFVLPAGSFQAVLELNAEAAAEFKKTVIRRVMDSKLKTT